MIQFAALENSNGDAKCRELLADRIRGKERAYSCFRIKVPAIWQGESFIHYVAIPNRQVRKMLSQIPYKVERI